MIELSVVPKKPPLSGYEPYTQPQYELFGLWLDGDVRAGGDDYDIEGLWRHIGEHLRGGLPVLYT